MATIQKPQISVLPDHDNNVATTPDLFALESRLSPVFDVLRHKETSTPTAVALYGQKGTGRTTALHWLLKQSDDWNQVSKEDRAGHPQLISVWISAPHLRDDGCPEKGIVSNMALKCLEHPQENETKQEFLRQLVESGAENLGHHLAFRLKQLAKQWKMDNLPPSPAQLPNPELPTSGATVCESCLALIEEWMERQDSNLRMALFIDGLDHCRPNVTMRILDTLGLRFQSGAFIFVVGLDDTTAKKMILLQHQEYGAGEVEAQQYLNRIFPIECQITPSKLQLKNFYDYQLNRLNEKTEQLLDRYLSTKQKEYVESAILHLAQNNPREIKVMLGGAVMAGQAALQWQASTSSGRSSRLFAQNIQLYLLQRWLSFSPLGMSAIHQEAVSKWIEKLSAEACKPNADYKRVQNGTLDQDYRRPLRSSYGSSETDRFAPPEGLNFEMIEEWVWDLLKIPFNINIFNPNIQESNEEGEAFSPEQDPMEEASDAIKSTLAAALGKPVGEVLGSDLKKVIALDFSGQTPTESDFSILGKLENLKNLDLHNSQVKTLDWIVELKNLKTLNLTCTPVLDITPLSNLDALKNLDLSYTAVTNLSPITQLENLEQLVLYGTTIKSIEELKGMKQLERLNLSHTEITDRALDALESIPSLKNLYLQNTSVSRERIAQLSRSFEGNLQVEH
jgi:Leucine-rich repeat (LRR) protein